MSVSAKNLELNVESYMQTVGQKARQAVKVVSAAETGQKNAALLAAADALIASEKTILAENQIDLQAGRDNGLDDALLDRLALNPDRVAAIADGLRQIAALEDPVGEISDMRFRPSGIQVGRMRVPLGVIGIIYESRPNVTADAAALCLKSGNATVLRGGSEAFHSNQAIAACLHAGLETAGLPADIIQVIETTDRSAVGHLLTMSESVDVIIPRGGKSLIERVSRESEIPVIKHLDGICHVYIDSGAEINKAIDIAVNAKTHRYGVCNAMETLLIAEDIAPEILPELIKRYKDLQVELRGCEKTCKLAKDINAAAESDWATEYLAPVLSIKLVSDIDKAIEHINHYGSHHTDAIVTEDINRAKQFLRKVDSSSVMINASTRFADGYEYGLGAEIGISTDKLHARGPVGLEGLTTLKYVVWGEGHIRQ